MDDKFGKIDTGSKVLDFILYFICFGFVFSLICTVIKLIVVCIAGGAEAYDVKRHNEALKTVVKLLYKYKIQKQDLKGAEVNKLLKCLKVAGVKDNANVQDIKDCIFEVIGIYGTSVSWDNREHWYNMPSLLDCGVKIQ